VLCRCGVSQFLLRPHTVTRRPDPPPRPAKPWIPIAVAVTVTDIFVCIKVHWVPPGATVRFVSHDDSLRVACTNWFHIQFPHIPSPPTTLASSFLNKTDSCAPSSVVLFAVVVTRRLTTGIRSEKCVDRRFRRRANVTVCPYRNLDNIAYYTPRLYGIAYCS